MEFIYEIMWFSLWPIVIYTGYKIAFRNAVKFEEKLSR